MSDEDMVKLLLGLIDRYESLEYGLNGIDSGVRTACDGYRKAIVGYFGEP